MTIRNFHFKHVPFFLLNIFLQFKQSHVHFLQQLHPKRTYINCWLCCKKIIKLILLECLLRDRILGFIILHQQQQHKKGTGGKHCSTESENHRNYNWMVGNNNKKRVSKLKERKSENSFSFHLWNVQCGI